MPRKMLMTWDGSPNFRWAKMYRGTTYRVSCDELRMPRDKEQSYQAANEWWEQKQAELGPKSAPKKIRPEFVSPVGQMAAFETLTRTNLATADAATMQELFNALGGKLDFAELQARMNAAADEIIEAKPIAKNSTIKHQLDRYLAFERARGIKPKSFSEVEDFLEKFVATDFFNGSRSVSTINEHTISTAFAWLGEQAAWNGETRNKAMGFFRRFVGWLASERLIDEPRNLRLKTMRFKVKAKAIKTYEGVAATIQGLPDNLALYALLGLNCGMTAADMGALTWEQIDPKKRTLTRKRVKTEDQENVPTVTYKLWPETLAALLATPRRTGLVFLTKTGKPLHQAWFDAEGKAKHKDLFGAYWKKHEPKPTIPLGKFRSIAATQFKKSIKYRGFADYFLGHAAGSMADKHYAAEANKPFFEALDFIHSQLFPKKKNGKNAK
jgi:integrase